MTPKSTRLARRDVLRLGACTATLASGCVDWSGGETGDTGTQSDPDVPVDVAEMSLDFEDAFRGDQLDSDAWSTEYPWESRTHNYNGFAAPDNAYLEDDRLVLRAEDEPRGGKDYTTGVVSTDARFSTGYFEARVRTPPARPGFWPALWLAPGDYWPPEIDVFEVFGTDSCIHMTYHYRDESGEIVELTDEACDLDASAEFHDYGIDWREDRIVWYVDGEERFHTEGEHVADDDLTLIFNFGIDSSFLDEPRSEDLPATLEMDRIRIWQR